MSDVVVTDNPELSRYEATIDGELAGFAAYDRDDEVIVLTHTEVLETLEGRGIGVTLVRGALDDIRAGRRQLVVRCPFVTSWMDKHPEYADLLER